MAGKRRQDGKLTRRANRAAVRLDILNRKLSSTNDPRERFTIAADHFRAAFSAQPDSIVAERLVQELVDAGNRLLTKSLGGPSVRNSE